MCLSTDFNRYSDRDRLKIKSFFVKFSGLDSHKPIPESVTLLYLPRINETELEVDGSKIRPDSAAFVTLHRVVAAAKTAEGEVVYGSREMVKASGGVQFVVYFREEKVLKGIFRKYEDDEWKLECKCGVEREIMTPDVAVAVAEAEVFVGVEGHVAMCKRVEMVVKRKNRCRRRVGFDKLEEIPEEREVETESDVGCCCSCDGSDVGDVEKGCDELEKEMEGVRWAVDLGIWVMCLGVGYFVSKASAKSLRRIRFL